LRGSTPHSKKNSKHRNHSCAGKKIVSTRIAVAHSEKLASGTGEQESLASGAISEGSPKGCVVISSKKPTSLFYHF